MRWVVIFLVLLAAFAGSAGAVTISNADNAAVRVFVCDEKCGPSFGEDWGTAFDFWLQPGEARSFSCAGSCFVGSYFEGRPPTLGDMAMAEDDEIFEGDEAGRIRGGYAEHVR